MPNPRFIPRHTKAQFDNYIIDGFPPGDFLRAVLENNLSEAFGRADNWNTVHLGNIVAYVFHCLPVVSHGSEDRVVTWLQLHRAGHGEIEAAIEDYKGTSENYLKGVYS